MIKTEIDVLIKECPLPAILHWNESHFVVLYKIRKSRKILGIKISRARPFVIADPSHGLMSLGLASFKESWNFTELNNGIALLLEPTAQFFSTKHESKRQNGYRFLIKYLRPFKKQVSLVILIMFLSTLITISFPYLTKGIVDKGVLKNNFFLVLLFAISQIVLFLSGTVLDILRSWRLLHINSKISLHIVSDFLKKMLRLPIRFFDSKSVGDVTQRIGDHHRIENFLTEDVIGSIFSILQIVTFTFILLYYNITIWSVFLILSVGGVVWILLFQKKRKQLDYLRFSQNRSTQEKLYELVVGMQEIKLYGSENSKRWEWEFVQQRLYNLNIRGLALEQYQQTGFSFLTNLKNIIISFITAIAVMNGKMSFGGMISISFILGQTNGPLEQLMRFFKSAQDAKISLDRLQEVHVKEDEEGDLYNSNENTLDLMNDNLPETIWLSNVTFQYQGPRSAYVLNNINVSIEGGEVTAIVGDSGCGKTTFMKILLGFYKPTSGDVTIGKNNLNEIRPSIWRSQCGTVLQDGYIFSDSVEKNIALDGKEINQNRFSEAIRISLVDDFIKILPKKYKTRIGSSGVGLSGGEKQRILIARAIYKDPKYIFLDEATSSLDANTEKLIINNLKQFFEGKTVIIIAHRLSTIKNADKIIVMDRGKVVECGNHQSLLEIKGRYHKLIMNQLDITEQQDFVLR
jgi:ATP-binding cassette subfamily B protein